MLKIVVLAKNASKLKTLGVTNRVLTRGVVLEITVGVSGLIVDGGG